MPTKIYSGQQKAQPLNLCALKCNVTMTNLNSVTYMLYRSKIYIQTVVKKNITPNTFEDVWQQVVCYDKHYANKLVQTK